MMNQALLLDSSMIFLGIVIEALPFILLGVVLSQFIGKFIKDETLLKIVPKNRFFGPFVASILGFLFPVCECGNIPVARRLINKGVPVYFSVSFLLAAPVLNPIVILSTLAAFPNQAWIIGIRLGATFLISLVAGWIFSFEKNPDRLVKESVSKSSPRVHGLKNELFEMSSMLIIGALVASFIQVILPREFILNLGQGQSSSIFAMMLLGALVSICSNVDAFFALSYMNIFTTGSVLAFLIFGPMIDIKALFMLSRIFRTRAIVWMTLISFSTTFLVALFINLNTSL